jgi:hypothetical protein
MSEPEAILITGVYGVGKSTMAAQIADLLEAAGVHYAALDLDWLAWAWSADDDHGYAMLLEHLALVVGNLRRRGNDRYVLAGAILRDVEWRGIRDTMAMPMRLVRLTASPEEIRVRLGTEPTTGRLEDAQQTEAWLAAPGDDEPTPDLVVANDSPIDATAERIVAWTRWLEADDRTA